MSAVPAALVDAYGLKPEQIHIYFHEVPDDRWGRGGVLASEAGTTQTVPAAADA
jgi:phenylpyruvate tautomerase PptA (4-oxalocrotonate tautomerase family)